MAVAVARFTFVRAVVVEAESAFEQVLEVDRGLEIWGRGEGRKT